MDGSWKVFGWSGGCLYGVWNVSGKIPEGVWKAFGSSLDEDGIQSKLNSCKCHLASLATKLTLDFTKIKIKTYTWNSSVALLSPTCVFLNSKGWSMQQPNNDCDNCANLIIPESCLSRHQTRKHDKQLPGGPVFLCLLTTDIKR